MPKIMGNPLKYYKLLNKLSKAKGLKNKPAPEFYLTQDIGVVQIILIGEEIIEHL